MIRELFLGGSLLWSCVWQSTIFVVVGLASSFILRHRSSRAHQVLFLAMMAAVVVPIISMMVKHLELGIFVVKPAVIQAQVEGETIANYREVPEHISTEVIGHKPAPVEENLQLAVAVSENAKFPWHSVMLCTWLTASLILVTRLIVTFVLGVRLLGRALPLRFERIEKAVHLALSKLRIEKDVSLCSSRSVRSPVIWCWRRKPVLLVPSEAGHSDNKIDWVGILCHELAHYKRRDHISGLLAELAVCILPWNPFLWWAKSRLARLSEQACDDWVVASGQSSTDYAESLLDLTPQGQMAFVPAVVTSKKGLAGRVRRILKDGCGNPQTGAAWAFAVIIAVVCLTICVAFAQTRPPQPTRTVKTKVGRSAAIEQLASTTMIKGRILDPNNEPAYLSSIVVLPMTSYGAGISLANKEGYFELPWSPTWIDEGQAICLVARGRYDRNEAAFVEVTDPTSPVTVRLEPAVTLTGKVVDPNGQPMSSKLILSLVRPFRCQAPIRTGTTAPPDHIDESRRGKFTIDMLPYNQIYKLNIQAEGYQTKQFIVDATDRSKEVIDIGTITLQPQDPTKPVVAEWSPNPDLMKEFDEVYRLDEGEVIKLIKPPFVLGRQDYLTTIHKGASSHGLSGGGFKVGFHWDGELEPRMAWAGPPRLNYVLRLIFQISKYDFNLSKELDVRLPNGDWIVRDKSSLEEQLRVLEEIIYNQLHRSIRFEKRIAEREFIVAKGRFEFKPHPSGDYPNHIHVTWDGTLNGGEGMMVGSLAKFLHSKLEIFIGMQIVDKTNPIENQTFNYRWSDKLYLLSSDQKLKRERLSTLLDNLAKTTSLQFKVESQPAEIWFVTEQNDDN